MVKITCKRCNASVPKSSTRGNAIWGGRICAKCAKEMGEVILRAGMGMAPPPRTEAPAAARTPKAQGFLRRAFNKLVRRRGVQ